MYTSSVIKFFAVLILLYLSIVFTVILIITIMDKIESLHGKRTKTYGRSRYNHSNYYDSGSEYWDDLGTNDMIMRQRMNDEVNRQFMRQMQEDSDTAMKMAT